MAKRYDNSKGFLIIEMDCLDASITCGFGIDTGHLANKIVCDNCNNEIDPFDDCYYIAVINRCVCKDCCEDIIKGLDKHEEDVLYEITHYNYYADKLNLEKIKL